VLFADSDGSKTVGALILLLWFMWTVHWVAKRTPDEVKGAVTSGIISKITKWLK
jgi:hypothetical protein